jgi:hypothetical protein
VELEIFRRMVLSALLAVSPGAAVDVDVEDDGNETAQVSATVRRAG